MSDSSFIDWLAALESRHLASLRPSEVSRALRSLSSYYVERRSKLAHGAALNTAGKRAAFALFYGPLHYLVTREIVTAIERARYVAQILDLGCGTGAAGAAWALASGRCTINGIDKHPWTIDEANWTYRQLGISGYAGQGDIARAPIRGRKGHGILAAYSVNELDDDIRSSLLGPACRSERKRLAHPDHRTNRQTCAHLVARMGGPILCRGRKGGRVAFPPRASGTPAGSWPCGAAWILVN